MSLEITKMLVISTGHLTEETCNSGKIGYEKGEYGVFVWVPPEVDEDAPQDLRVCHHLARINDCDWLMFDRDADTVDELPLYDW